MKHHTIETAAALAQQYISEADHHEVYRLHMAQARRARREFRNDPAKLERIAHIESRILETYRQACAVAGQK